VPDQRRNHKLSIQHRLDGLKPDRKEKAHYQCAPSEKKSRLGKKTGAPAAKAHVLKNCQTIPNTTAATKLNDKAAATKFSFETKSIDTSCMGNISPLLGVASSHRQFASNFACLPLPTLIGKYGSLQAKS
jgi:hypothetical protein